MFVLQLPHKATVSSGTSLVESILRKDKSDLRSTVLDTNTSEFEWQTIWDESYGRQEYILLSTTTTRDSYGHIVLVGIASSFVNERLSSCVHHGNDAQNAPSHMLEQLLRVVLENSYFVTQQERQNNQSYCCKLS